MKYSEGAILEIKRIFLETELEMQGMIAENKQREYLQQSIGYTEDNFMVLKRRMNERLDMVKIN